MKYILSTLAVCVLFFASCKTDLSNKKDEVAVTNPDYQEMKKIEVQADKVMPELIVYQKGLKNLLHDLEKANQISNRPSMTDSTSLKVRSHLSELNRAENAFANYKTEFNARLDTMVETRRAVFSSYGKQQAETARDMVLYSVIQAKKLVRQLRDKGMQLTAFPEEEAAH